MKNETISYNKNDFDIHTFLTQLVKSEEMDKAIMIEIVGIPTELSAFRSITRHLYNDFYPSTYNNLYAKKKINIRDRVRSKIEKSKMSRVQKAYGLVLVDEMIQ